MPRHDDVYLLYLCTHSQTAGTKSNQMKNVRSKRRNEKKVRQKRIKLILRVYFLHYALLMEVWFNIHIDGWIQWYKKKEKNTHTISFCAFFIWFISLSLSLSLCVFLSFFRCLSLPFFLNILFQPHSFWMLLGRLLVLFAIITIRKNIHMFFLLLSHWCCRFYIINIA